MYYTICSRYLTLVLKFPQVITVERNIFLNSSFFDLWLFGSKIRNDFIKLIKDLSEGVERDYAFEIVCHFRERVTNDRREFSTRIIYTQYV